MNYLILMILIVDPPKENRFNMIFLIKIKGEKIKLSIWEILEYEHFFKSKSTIFFNDSGEQGKYRIAKTEKT